MFNQYHNVLSDELLKELQAYYMRDDHEWRHRNFGRFFMYFTNEHHEAILEELYSNENTPLYRNKKMMRRHHMYLQRFIPGSWLPLHRERCYGVVTLYINPDENWNEDNPGPKFIYYDTDDLNNLEEHKFSYDIPCNSATIFTTADPNSAPQYNMYHRVEYNESEHSRYALQMFYGPSELSDGKTIHLDKNANRFYLSNGGHDSSVDQTANAIMSGSLDVVNIGQLTKNSSEYNEEYKDIIQRLEQPVSE